jgi:acetyltransferase-like isoleucine patch superfamily enzyme
MTAVMSEVQYKSHRNTPGVLLQLRKPLALVARFWLGWRGRVRLLRCMGVNIGHCYVGKDCLFDDEVPELITVEDGVVISSRVIIAAHDSSRHIVAPVHIHQQAFIGIGAIILPGVNIGKGAVVAAGAVVTRSVENYTMVAGVPARAVRRTAESDQAVMTHVR